jgi:hypothetical protein
VQTGFQKETHRLHKQSTLQLCELVLRVGFYFTARTFARIKRGDGCHDTGKTPGTDSQRVASNFRLDQPEMDSTGEGRKT